MSHEVKSISSGGTMATVSFYHSVAYDTYDINFTVLIADLFPECTTRKQLCAAVEKHAIGNKSDWIKHFEQDLKKADEYFDGIDDAEFCGVSMLARIDKIPVTITETQVLDFSVDYRND